MLANKLPFLFPYNILYRLNLYIYIIKYIIALIFTLTDIFWRFIDRDIENKIILPIDQQPISANNLYKTSLLH